jgi:riboflavin kinase/FMN adenylyltransferase
MEVFHQLGELTSQVRASSVAIGNFDGVHLGHAELLSTMCQDAKQNGYTSVVLTFFPHPVEVLNPAKTLERLTTTPEKLEALAQLGVEKVLVAPFDRELAALEPEAFYRRFLAEGIKAKSVHVGFNFRFGRNRAGDTKLLGQLCAADGIALNAMPAFELEGKKVSSTTIRECVREGHVAEAARLLGRPYAMSGQVLHGDARGRQLGFPTANLHFPQEKVLPKRGVYITKSLWQGQWYRSVSNVGVRPTFGGAPEVTVEVHLLDFNARIYDEMLKIEFLDRIRDEKKFDSVAALRAQIEADVETARNATNWG